jgi:hypothetical protein
MEQESLINLFLPESLNTSLFYTRTLTTMKERFTLSKKLASYSALATVVLAGSKAADGQILYTDINPDDTTHLVGSYLLDLNNDGTTDFQFNLIHKATSSGGTDPLVDEIHVVGAGNNSVLAIPFTTYSYYYYAKVLAAGVLIDGSASFKNLGMLATHSGGYIGSWVNVSDRFLGLQLIVNSNTYYGWARLSVNQECNQLIVSDYAVDTVANDGIAAGDKCGNYSVYANTVINPSGSVPLCEGSNTILATDSIGGFTYQWLVDGNIIAGANNFNYTVNSTGNYSVIATNSYGCVDTALGTQVTVFTLPAIPVISQTVDTLISTAASTYQWYLNNVLIPGATNQTYIATLAGDYVVQITDINGCTSLSSSYAFVPTGISNADGLSISVFEANNIVFVQLKDQDFLNGQIKIRNARGNNLYTSIVHTETFQIDLSQIPAGIYLLTIENSTKTITRKIVIQ